MPSISPACLQSLLGPVAGRFDVDSVESIDSTSSELMRRAANGAPSGSTLVADRQTAGRGRRGRQWHSAPEDSLTFSLLWRFERPVSALAGLSLAVGVGLAQALESLGATEAGLKWPNDVLLDGGKVAGILVELSSERRGTLAVIGIGLNLRNPPADLPFPASGLADALSPLPERHVILAAILVALARSLDTFETEGFRALRAAWQTRHAWQGQPVRVLQDGQEEISGRCLGADDDGALLIATATGTVRFLSGDVSLRHS